MLKEVSFDEILSRADWNFRATETSEFCRKELTNFISSDIKAAIVEGWPKGEPDCKAKTNSYLSSMKSKIKIMKIENVSCFMRNGRIYLVKEES